MTQKQHVVLAAWIVYCDCTCACGKFVSFQALTARHTSHVPAPAAHAAAHVTCALVASKLAKAGA
jgi:hypothetical protein